MGDFINRSKKTQLNYKLLQNHQKPFNIHSQINKYIFYLAFKFPT